MPIQNGTKMTEFCQNLTINGNLDVGITFTFHRFYFIIVYSSFQSYFKNPENSFSEVAKLITTLSRQVKTNFLQTIKFEIALNSYQQYSDYNRTLPLFNLTGGVYVHKSYLRTFFKIIFLEKFVLGLLSGQTSLKSYILI